MLERNASSRSFLAPHQTKRQQDRRTVCDYMILFEKERKNNNKTKVRCNSNISRTVLISRKILMDFSANNKTTDKQTKKRRTTHIFAKPKS